MVDARDGSLEGGRHVFLARPGHEHRQPSNNPPLPVNPAAHPLPSLPLPTILQDPLKLPALALHPDHHPTPIPDHPLGSLHKLIQSQFGSGRRVDRPLCDWIGCAGLEFVCGEGEDVGGG